MMNQPPKHLVIAWLHGVIFGATSTNKECGLAELNGNDGKNWRLCLSYYGKDVNFFENKYIFEPKN